ncbi:ATP-dependent DNA helicase [Halocatena halophila]|uniref:ATP-dependent DNA helicase n=1 Tax=Halocatena halophila TaxID=2814576 RepID=UPI002ED3E0F6
MTRVADQSVPRDSIAASWADLFPFDPYPQQVDGVEQALSTCGGAETGYLLLEGACGTGKTLLALVAGRELLEREAAERLLVVTPVKQQLAQFVTDLRALNQRATATDYERTNGIVLVGKRDLLPYARTNTLGTDDGESVHDTASALRDTTVELVRRNSVYELAVQPGDLDGRVSVCIESDCNRNAYDGPYCPDHRSSSDEEDESWYDPVRAAAVTDLVAALEGDRLQTADVSAPFPERPPTIADVVVEYGGSFEDDRQFDPFYANYFASEEWIPFGFDQGTHGVLDSDAVVATAVSRGLCPHEAMASLMADADVLIGNYNHAFDPVTRQLTDAKAGVLDENTLLVVDEAHMLEERLRDLLSQQLGLHTLRTAHRDLVLARSYLAGTGGDDPGTDPTLHKQSAQRVLAEFSSLTDGDLARTQSFLEWLMEAIDEHVSDYLDAQYTDWQRSFKDRTLPEIDHEIGLRPPQSDERSTLTNDAVGAFDEEIFQTAATACLVAATIHEEDGQTERTPAADGVGSFFDAWHRADTATHFREIELEYAPKPNVDTSLPAWARAYNARLSLFNCLPHDPLANIFDELGGGILMSATLAPFDVYERVSGLKQLACETETTQYGLSFPPENRASWIVECPAFTYRNRGPPAASYDAMSATRQAHAAAMVTIARSPGNVLLCLPSYAEADWAATLLEDAIDKPVLQDQSSDMATTDAMLERFFNDDETDRVLVSSARGTVTEGVDYRGERLHTAAVIGIPYANTATPRMQAVQFAYDRAFDGAGFEYAVAIPAIRKARQAIGRVLRDPEEIGTRLLVDERYDRTAPRSVNAPIATDQESFTTVSTDMLEFALEQFWDDH